MLQNKITKKVKITQTKWSKLCHCPHTYVVCFSCKCLTLKLFCGAGGEVQDGVSVVSGQQQGGYVFKPLLHPRIWQGSLPCCQHAPPRALGSVLHPLEPTHTTAGRTALVFPIICCKLAWINMWPAAQDSKCCVSGFTCQIMDIWIYQPQNSEITAQKQL